MTQQNDKPADQYAVDKLPRAPVVDCHTHIFCWGENPNDGYLSRNTRQRWLTRLIMRLTGVTIEPGATISEKIRHRYLRDLNGSNLDYAVCLAQDAVYRPDGSRDDDNTHF